MRQTQCPICAVTDYLMFLVQKGAIVHQQFLMRTREEAERSRRGDIELAFCRNCGTVWNTAFDPSLLEYETPYEASQSLSPAFEKYMTGLVRHLVREYDLHHKRIIEIGSGDGKFLQLLCQMGDNLGTGFEPSWEGAGFLGTSRKIQIVRDHYSDRYADSAADIICCRHVLEHIQNPTLFLREILNLNKLSSPVFFFEVPNFSWSLRERAFWDIYYEHCLYFSSVSLSFLFSSCGFRVLKMGHGFGGQYLCMEARGEGGAERRRVRDVRTRTGVRALLSRVNAFSTYYQRLVEDTRRRMSRVARGSNLVIWGAGAKTVAFLNLLGIWRDQIEYVVDVNPRKWGTYVPGTGQQIVSPDSLQTHKPDIVMVMNPGYRSEIKRTMTRIGVTAKVVTMGRKKAL